MGADIFHIAVADQPRLVHHGAAVLKDHGDIMAAQLAPLLVGQSQQIHAVVSNAAGGNPAPSGKQAHSRADYRGLAAARLADDTANLAFLKAHADFLYREVLAVGNIYILDIQ